MPLTTGLAIPKSPLIAPMMTDAMMTIIPRTRNVAKVLSHLWPTRTRLLPMLSVTPLFSIRRTGSARKSRKDERLPRQCSDDLDDHSHYRKENEILGEVSSIHLEGFRDNLAETQLAADTLLRLHRHISSSCYGTQWDPV